MAPREDEIRELKGRLQNVEVEVSALRARLARLEAEAAEEAQASGERGGAGSPAQPAVRPPPLPRQAPREPQPQPMVSAEGAATAATAARSAGKAAGAAARPTGAGRVRRFLEAVHLAPPADGSGEAVLAAWWTTRLGALLAVIGVVFFGVYLSLNTPPWVKLVELCAVSVGMALAGGWLERRVPRFGAVVLGAGLALVYFTAFAAYAVPAVKVTDHAGLAVGLQGAAVVLIYAVALWRSAPTTAAMATLLGYVSAFFSVSAGFDDFAIYGGIALLAVAVLLRWRRRWSTPLGAAAVLVHAVYVAVTWTIWSTPLGRPADWLAPAVLATHFALVFGSLLLERPAGTPPRFARAQRWIQALNTPLLVLAGLAAVSALHGEGMVGRYLLTAGAVLGAAAWGVQRRAPGDGLVGMFGVKAAALVALGVCAQWGERVQWAALGVEAFVVLAAGGRARSRALKVAAAGIWLVSLVIFAGDVRAFSGATVGAAVGWTVAGYALAGLVFWTWWWRSISGTAEGKWRLSVAMVAVLAAVPMWEAGDVLGGARWSGLGFLGLALAAGGWGAWRRARVPVVGTVLALLWAHREAHGFDELAWGGGWLWLNVVPTAALSAAAGWWCAERRAREPGVDPALWWLCGVALTAAALVVLSSGVLQSVGQPLALALSAVGMSAVAWAGQARGRSMPVGAAVAALAALPPLTAWVAGSSAWSMGYDERWLWGAAAGAMATFAGAAWPGRVREALDERGWLRGFGVLGAFASVLLSWQAATRNLEGAWVLWAVTGLAALHVAGGLRWRSGAGLAAGAVLALLLMARLVVWSGGATAGWETWLGLAGAMACGWLFAAVPAVAMRTEAAWRCVRWGRLWTVGHAVGAGAFVAGVALERGVPWTPLASVVWAIGAIGIFFAGLFWRSRAHRLVGLALLAGCVGRVFMVDITSTLYRIAAFVVLGGVLLWIGFSYHRFRHMIDGDDDAEPPSDGEPDEAGAAKPAAPDAGGPRSGRP
ncbi:MAG: DUF2339 domain-containing protein [Verrucomicrobia bacterium]|nr:MAG: DUF2339 domain-containing protein [Verrucomicrobiota bacterium]